MGAADSEGLGRAHVSFRLVHFKQQRCIWGLLRSDQPPESRQKSAHRDAGACRWCVLTEERRQVGDGLQERLGVHALVRGKRFELVIQQKRHNLAGENCYGDKSSGGGDGSRKGSEPGSLRRGGAEPVQQVESCSRRRGGK